MPWRTGPEWLPASGSWVQPPMSKPSGWWKLLLLRIEAPNMWKLSLSPVSRARPAGLKWIEAMPGGSAVTALPSAMATTLVVRFSVSAARAPDGDSAQHSAAAAHADRAAAALRRGRVFGPSGVRRVRMLDIERQVHAHRQVGRGLRGHAVAQAQVQDAGGLHGGLGRQAVGEAQLGAGRDRLLERDPRRDSVRQRVGEAEAEAHRRPRRH